MPKLNASTPRSCPMISFRGDKSSVVLKGSVAGSRIHLNFSTGTSLSVFLAAMVINLLHVVSIEQQARQKANHEKDGLGHFDLDLADRLGFALGHDNVQNSVLVGGSNLVHVNLAGELDGARKETAGLHSLAETFALGEGFLLNARPDREQVIADGDVQVTI